MENIKIIAKVKFNNEYAYVLDRKVDFLYTKMDDETIIGYYEGMYRFYKKDTFCSRWNAFGGHKFQLKLTDGNIEECYGQWWDGMTNTARELLSDVKLDFFTFSSIDELKRCYVYTGCYCDKEWLDKLDKEYTGKIYEYYEYEKVLKNSLE